MTNLHSGRKTCGFLIGAVSGLIFYVLRPKLRTIFTMWDLTVSSRSCSAMTNLHSGRKSCGFLFLAQCSYIFSFFCSLFGNTLTIIIYKIGYTTYHSVKFYFFRLVGITMGIFHWINIYIMAFLDLRLIYLS